MNTKNKKVLYAIHNNPLLIGTLYKDTSINKGMIHRILKKSLPCRIGIEFELSGNFPREFIKKYNKGFIAKKYTYSGESQSVGKYLKESNIDKIMTKHYNVFEISSDKYIDNDDQISEIRISLKNYSQLKGLYLFMRDLSEFCKLHEGGGIHIHVDISEYYPLNKVEEVRSYITNRLDEVTKIFPKYTGKYNHREVGIQKKATYVNISTKKSLEFRIAPLTFDYSTLINWIINCIKFRNNVICNCKLKKLPKIESKIDKLCYIDVYNVTNYITGETSNIYNNGNIYPCSI